MPRAYGFFPFNRGPIVISYFVDPDWGDDERIIVVIMDSEEDEEAEAKRCVYVVVDDPVEIERTAAMLESSWKKDDHDHTVAMLDSSLKKADHYYRESGCTPFDGRRTNIKTKLIEEIIHFEFPAVSGQQ